MVGPENAYHAARLEIKIYYITDLVLISLSHRSADIDGHHDWLSSKAKTDNIPSEIGQSSKCNLSQLNSN